MASIFSEDRTAGALRSEIMGGLETAGWSDRTAGPEAPDGTEPGSASSDEADFRPFFPKTPFE
jgi:hypothetical protein